VDPLRAVPLPCLALAAALALPACAAALETGEPLDDRELPTLAGGKAHLVQAGVVNVLVFVRPGHGHCLDTLRDFASREGRPAGTRWAAVVPGDVPLAETRAQLAGTGIRMPVLLDPGDAVYGRLALKLHPTVVVVDRQGRLAAVEPYREVNYGDRLEARLRFTLGELTEAQLAEAIDPPAAETRSDSGMARSNLRFAQQLLELGQLDQALATAQRGLALEPSAQGYLLQGRILARQGKCPEAARAFDMALRLEPGNAQAAGEKAKCGK
jgi:hypothetical protein